MESAMKKFFELFEMGRTDEEIVLDYANKGVQVEAIKLNGSMELAPSLNMCRRIVDLVSTGKTLKENGLIKIEDLFFSTARLIANPLSIRLDNKWQKT